MRKLIVVLAVVCVSVGVFWIARAGDLEPLASPAPTMVTLQELSDKLTSLQPTPDTCYDNTGNRFVDCGNGTVKDTETGLFWLKDANCFASSTWAAHNIAAAQLADGQCGLTDGSRPGDWRLPTLECSSGISCALTDATGEFASIFAPACPPPFILNTAGTGCWSEGDPFSDVRSSFYWSGSTFASSPADAWSAILDVGDVFADNKDCFDRSWPVRGGP